MMEQMAQDMMKKVDEFQRTILKVPYKKYPQLVDKSRYAHMIEEVNETIGCHDRDDVAGVVDGLVDLVYVALGTLLQMGIYPSYPFDEVHAANMRKKGAKTDRHEHDAIKGVGWVPPNHEVMLEYLRILHAVSPVFVDLTKLRIKKGNNYNRGNVTREMHFPLGDLSYFQVIWMKTCRIRSLVENPDKDSRRLVERELNDIMVYACFWAEFMREIMPHMAEEEEKKTTPPPPPPDRGNNPAKFVHGYPHKITGD